MYFSLTKPPHRSKYFKKHHARRTSKGSPRSFTFSVKSPLLSHRTRYTSKGSPRSFTFSISSSSPFPASRDPFDAGIRPTEHPLGSEPIFPTLSIDPPGRSTRLRLYSSNPIKTEWVHLIPSIYLALLIISPFLTRSSISPHSFSPCSHFIYPAFQASL